MANTLAATLAALNPSSYWLLDEAATNGWADSGSGGYTLHPDGVSAGNGLWQAPGLAEGSPRVYGAWNTATNSSQGNPRTLRFTATGYAASGWTSGGLGAFVCLPNTTVAQYVIGQTFDGDSSRYIAIRVNSDLSVDFLMEGLGTIGVQAQSRAGVFTPGRRHYVYGQMGDGVSQEARIFLDGVDVTDTVTTGGGASATDTLDDIYSTGGVAQSIFMLNGSSETPSTTQANAIISMPHIFRNTALTPAQVLSIYQAAGYGTGHDDYLEYMIDTVAEHAKIYHPVLDSYNGQVSQTPVLTLTDSATNRPTFQGGTTGAIEDDAYFDGIGSTAYDKKSWDLTGTDDDAYLRNWTTGVPLVESGDPGTVGTLSFIMTWSDVDPPANANIFNLNGTGATGNESGPSTFHIGMEAGVGSEGQLTVDVTIGGVLQFSWFTSETIFSGMTTVFTIVQDGTGYKFYINGQREGGAINTNLDDTFWMGDIMKGTPGVTESCYIYKDFTDWDTGDAHEFFYLDGEAWSALQVAEHFNAIQGNFPTRGQNTYIETLDGLIADGSYWPADQAGGLTVEDAGPQGLDLAFDGAVAGSYLMPGLCIGAPRVYGIWQTEGDYWAPFTETDGMDADDWDTGGMGCLALLGRVTGNRELMRGVFDNNTGEFISLRVTDDYAVICEIQFGGSTTLRATTDDNVLLQGQVHHIVADQDGTGIAIYIDGESVTVTFSGTEASTERVEQMRDTAAVAGVGTDFYIGSDDIIGPFLNGIMSVPFIYRGSFGATNIKALYDSANLAGNHDDWQEFVLHTYRPWAMLHLGGNLGNKGGIIPGLITGGTDGGANGTPAFGTGTGALWEEDLTDIAAHTNYPRYRFRADFDPNAYSTNGAPAIGETNAIPAQDPEDILTGTMNLIFTVQQFTTQSFLMNLGFGNTTGLGFTFEDAAPGSGGFIRVRMGDDMSTDILDWGSGLDDDDIFGLDETVMFTLVQDGTRLHFYVNGVPRTGIFTIGDAEITRWWGQIIANSASANINNWSLGTGPGIAGTQFSLENINHGMFMREVLSAEQVFELYNVIFNGVFPTRNSAAPPNGFYNTLITTGNADDPNGPGPDHYWRMNAPAAGIDDIGISDVDGSSILTGGDPLFLAPGPLILDPTNFAVLFDGQGDYFEIGVDGVSGDLMTASFGTIGFFISADPSQNQIIYSQSDDLATEFMRVGVNAGRLEFFLQTSAGNSVTFRSSIEIDSLDFVFAVLTNDGAGYQWFVNGELDANATLTLAGTGTAGAWFDDIPNATRTAIAARADASFNEQLTGRVSEVFAYIDEVLPQSAITGLFLAAVADGVGTAANPNATVIFEDCIFDDAGASAIRVQNTLEGFTQVLQVNRCRFHGGSQGPDRQAIRLQGVVNAQVRGCQFDMGNELITTGRGAVFGTTANPSAIPGALGTVLVSDCVLDGLGRPDDAAIFIENGFAMTVEDCQIRDSVAAAIGWRATSERMMIARNMIDGLQSGVAGIRVIVGLHTGVGSGWVISGNEVKDATDGILINGDNSAGTRGRFISVDHNLITGKSARGIVLDDIQDAQCIGNSINGGTEGIRIGDMATLVRVAENYIEGHSAQAIILANGIPVSGFLTVEDNTIVGNLSNDGITVSGVSNSLVRGNQLSNLSIGISIGNITTGVQIFKNTLFTVATPFDLLGGTTQAGLDIGENQLSDYGADLQPLTVVANAIDVSAPYHRIGAGMATDLDNIGGPDRDGKVVVLQQGPVSAAITATSAGDMTLSSNFVMSAGDTLWLIKFDGEWYELSRSVN